MSGTPGYLASPASLAVRVSRGSWRPAGMHRVINHGLVRLAARDITRLVITTPPRHGKALDVSTPIPTPDGWTAIGDLRPGDKVFDETGAQCNVVAVSAVWRDREVFTVSSDTGFTVTADGDHEWLVRACRKSPDRLRVHDTRWLARPRERATMVTKAGCLDLPDVLLPVDPYVLGVWLGDGATDNATVTQGVPDLEHIRGAVERAGYVTTDRATPGTFGIRGLQIHLRTLGVLGAKRIPPMYLRSSRRQRMALLQGLIDTDGHVAPDGQVEFCSVNRCIARGVLELVRSLGTKASMIEGDATLDGRFISRKYRVMFYMADAARLPRKRVRCRDGVKSVNHYVRAEPCGTADTVCIQVDSASRMFLAGEGMIPTHNSELVSHWLPVWWLALWPHNRVILTSYEASFARTWGRAVRNTIAGNPELFPDAVTLAEDSAAANQWNTRAEGGMVTAGAGGAITGRGADLFIIDDPYKNRQDADSPLIRRRVWEWWESTARTRLEPDAVVVLVQTRWHEDDIGGRLIRDGWPVIRLPAIADHLDHNGDPCGGDPLGRQVGEALWPDRYDAAALDEIRRDVGAYVWGALFQALPSPPEGGGLWTRDGFRAARGRWLEWGRPTTKDCQTVVVAVDPPGGRTECGVQVVGALPEDRARGVPSRGVVFEDATTGAGERWGKAVVDAYHRHGADRVVVETNYGGDMVVDTIHAIDPTVPVRAVTATRGKRVRAEPCAVMYDLGRVAHMGDFPALEDECVRWEPDAGMESPNRMDALVWALTDLGLAQERTTAEMMDLRGASSEPVVRAGDLVLRGRQYVDKDPS